jgi:hypothetical protein
MVRDDIPVFFISIERMSLLIEHIPSAYGWDIRWYTII